MNLTWRGTVTALTSTVHGSETRGTVTLLRRESILSPQGSLLQVPLVSGNSWRGILRRVAEDLTRREMNYDGRLTLAATAALQSGGALAKTSRDPISGVELARLRQLVPLIGVFGTAGGGRIIEGCLQVGKLLPICRETQPMTGRASNLMAADLTGVETYSRHDDSLGPHTTVTETKGTQLQYRIETFKAGTQFDAWLNLTHPTDREAAFLAAVLDEFGHQAHIGGRAAIGHGLVRTELTPNKPVPQVDWRPDPGEIDQAIDLLNLL